MAEICISDKRSPFAKNLTQDPSQFRVSAISEGNCRLTSFNRRDFYKVTLVLKGNSLLQYADKEIEITQPALVFANPSVPYSWEGDGHESEGYFCVFSEGFVQASGRVESLQDSTLFKAGGNPVYFLNAVQTEYIQSIFTRMRSEFESDYLHKLDVIRNQLHLILHEAIKMQPAVNYASPLNAAARITTLFLDELEKQFPLDFSQQDKILRTAGDFARQLTVHVNHLNAAIQEVTSKSTTVHIRERLLTEARSLLVHTDWSIAEIAFTLGFEYASYFTHFFKKHTGLSPLALRNQKTAPSLKQVKSA